MGIALTGLAPVAMADDNILQNPSFESVEGGVPTSWKVSVGGTSKWEPLKPGIVSDAPDGKQAIEIPAPPEGDLAIVHQAVPQATVALETTMRFELQGKSSTQAQLQAVVSFETSEGPRKVRVIHPGDGQWALMEIMFDIPRTADLSTFNVEIIVRPGAGPVEVDAVKLWHEEIAPQYHFPENGHE